MAQYNRKALLGELGIDDEASQQIDPVGPAMEVPAPAADPIASPAAPDYRKLGKYAGQMGAWSTDAANHGEKFARPWDDMSERYKMLTIQSNFDPTKGISQEMVDALNAANIKGAKFSRGSDDRLSATGLENWENYDGREGLGDIIQGFKTGKGQWGAWAPEGGDAPAASGAQSFGGGIAPFGGVPLDDLVTGDPLRKIQQAIAQLSTSRPNAAALLSQLGAR